MKRDEPVRPEITGDAIVDRERRLLWAKERGEFAVDEMVSQEQEQNDGPGDSEETPLPQLPEEVLYGVSVRKWAFEFASENVEAGTSFSEILDLAKVISDFVLIGVWVEEEGVALGPLGPETGAGEPTEGTEPTTPHVPFDDGTINS